MLCKNPCLWFAAGLLALATLLGLLFGSGGGAGSSSTPDGNYSTILENDLPAGAKKPFITYQDNSGDQSALKTALGALVPNAAGAIQNGQAVQVYSTTDGYTGAASSLTNALTGGQRPGRGHVRPGE